MSKVWTPEENALLAELRKGMGPMKVLADKIPGRTVCACVVHATKTGMGARHHSQYATRFSWVDGLVADALKENPGRTVRELVEITGASYAGCHRAITEGHGSRYHVSGWTRFRSTQKWTAKWSLGEGEDVPKPRRLSSAESKRRCKEFKKLKAQAANPFAVAMTQILQVAA